MTKQKVKYKKVQNVKFVIKTIVHEKQVERLFHVHRCHHHLQYLHPCHHHLQHVRNKNN